MGSTHPGTCQFVRIETTRVLEDTREAYRAYVRKCIIREPGFEKSDLVYLDNLFNTQHTHKDDDPSHKLPPENTDPYDVKHIKTYAAGLRSNDVEEDIHLYCLLIATRLVKIPTSCSERSLYTEDDTDDSHPRT